ncbi:MAG: hypothetical protein ACFCUT_14625 [Kiloniellaceae bacterium]
MIDVTGSSKEPASAPNPHDLMRARRPELFSDSKFDHEAKLAREVFEYHLDTLTSRKQEYEFEHFCRKLAEKEICPNLRVQTGPTGGGDSKVDTETYPVAPEISERWWIGEPSAGSERWAFAFSAKKTWRAKAKKDVQNVLSTNREYSRIYFFTNQFASDKQRSKLEDELTKTSGIPITIVDRSWIVDRVYKNGHVALAISTLGIEGVGSESRRRPGPRDVERQAELDELDSQIADSSRYHGARYQLAEDCLRSAVLARGLERPRSEVESRFAQAERIAKELGFPHQQMRIAYNRAWTAFWWHEDYRAFSDHYDVVEEHLGESDLAGDIERLLTLWQLIPPSVKAGQMSSDVAKLEPRREHLATLLNKVANNPARPNNALQAKTSLVLMRMTVAAQSGSLADLDSVWAELSQIVEDSRDLGAYPIQWLSDLARELGQYIDSPSFDSFYETIVDVVRRRQSDGRAGEAYSERGMQKLLQGHPYQAIQWFGRAEDLLVKDEYRAQLVNTLGGSSFAYERVGLLWAARNKILAAIERSFGTFLEDGEVTPPTLLALQRLVWLELQLGRIPHVLDAMSLAALAAAHMKLSDERKEAQFEEAQIQEGVLGIHLLNIRLEKLRSASRLPDALQRLGLTYARAALLFSLGQMEALFDEEYFAEDEASEEIESFFERWHSQPAGKDIPCEPIFVEGSNSRLHSVVLGSRIEIDTPSDPTSFGVAESFLGALEAFLATSNENQLMPHKERTTITIHTHDDAPSTPEIRFFDDDGSRAEIVHQNNLQFRTKEDIFAFRKWLQKSVLEFIVRSFVIRDVERWMDRLAGDERGFSRALMLGDMVTLDRNVFGDRPRITLDDWLTDEDRIYDVLRTEHWQKKEARKQPDDPEFDKPLEFGSGPPPDDMFDWMKLKHSERRILSPIDKTLWDRAGWSGALYAEADGWPPFLGLIFKDQSAGTAIFRGWRERWGKEDEEDSIRVTIIVGVSKKNPTHYSIVIGPNQNQLREHKAAPVLMISRIQRMQPSSSENLDRFLASYNRFGAYFLVPAQMGPPPTLSSELPLLKHQLHHREAWQISENDPDMMALDQDDDPIIPNGEVDPPVKRALELKRRREQNRKRDPEEG